MVLHCQVVHCPPPEFGPSMSGPSCFTKCDCGTGIYTHSNLAPHRNDMRQVAALSPSDSDPTQPFGDPLSLAGYDSKSVADAVNCRTQSYVLKFAATGCFLF